VVSEGSPLHGLVQVFVMTHLATLSEISHAGTVPQFPYILAPILAISSYVPPISSGIDGNPRPIQILCDNCHTLIAIGVSDSIDVTRPFCVSMFNSVNCIGLLCIFM
jgi:hypothetical protein